jgi:hypothetical protein
VSAGDVVGKQSEISKKFISLFNNKYTGIISVSSIQLSDRVNILIIRGSSIF